MSIYYINIYDQKWARCLILYLLPIASCAVAPVVMRIRALYFYGTTPSQRRNLRSSANSFCRPRSNLLHYEINRKTVFEEICYIVCNA